MRPNQLKTTTCRTCGHIFGISALLDISWVTACEKCIHGDSNNSQTEIEFTEQEVKHESATSRV